MSDKEQAENCVKKAEELLKSESGMLKWMGSLFAPRDSEKTEEAIELFRKAGSRFRVAELWKEAADSYLRAAELSTKHQNESAYSTQDYLEAAQCQRKFAPEKSVELYKKSAEFYIDKGRHALAAKYYSYIAEIYEKDLINISECIVYYEKAANLYLNENSLSTANKMFVKVAQYCALQSEYAKSIKIYEKIGGDCLGNNLLRLSANDYFFKACLVSLAYDMLEAQKTFGKFCTLSSSFKESRQADLIKEIIRSAEEGNVQIFDEAIKKYDSIVHLDEFTSTILLRVKGPIENLFDIT